MPTGQCWGRWTTCLLYTSTSAGEATLKLKATIRSSTAEETGGGRVHGVQFVRLEPMDLLALEGYVAHAATTAQETD